MDIPYAALLKKMEQELARAKQAGGPEAKPHIYAIKALAELMLEEGQPVGGHSVMGSGVQQSSFEKAPQLTVRNERVKMEDGSNGDSIFDF